MDLTINPNLDTNNFNIFPEFYSRKKIALVLSGGGARGIAQLGVIEELEKNNIRIDMVVGTSIGSMIGGLYSSGYTSSEIEKILTGFDWNRALSLTNKYQRTSLFLEQKKIQDRSLLTIPLDGITPVLLPSSLSNGYYLSEKINSFILNSRYHVRKDFSELKKSFTAVATDLDRGKRVLLTSGNLSESIKASLTFPLLYSPIEINGKKLVDGGLTSNIPNDVAKQLGADYTIVVNSTSPLRSNRELDDPLNTADQILSITMQQLNNLQLKDANIIITPDIKKFSSTDYRNISYLISKGKEETSKFIDKIITGIDSLELSESKYFNNFVTNPTVVINSNYSSQSLNEKLLGLTDKSFEKYISIEKNLKMLYRTGSFKDVFATVSRNEITATIEYNLVTFPALKGVQTNNTFAFLDAPIMNFQNENTGKAANSIEYKYFYEDLLGLLRKNSFSLVEITKFYFNYDSDTLEIEFDKGEISELRLDGNTRTNENVILREVTISNSSPVKKNDIDESLNRVMSTNLFKQVSFDFEYPDNSLKPALKIKLVEKNTRALRLSLKTDNEKNFQMLIDLRDENIMGSAVEAGLLAAGGLRNRIYQFEVKTNQFFRLPFAFNYNFLYTFRDYNRYSVSIDTINNEYDLTKFGEYRTIKYGMNLFVGTQLQRFGTLFAQASIENQQIKNKFGSEDLPVEFRMVKLMFGGIFDTQDILPFPTKGSLINFSYESAKNILAGSFSYTKLHLSYHQYFPVGRNQTLRPRFIFGFADKTTPLTEQFSLGGERSFFGMVEDELRGRQILETSIEYRYLFPYRIFFDTYLSIRYDVGNVWQVTEDIRFRDLKHGLGLTAGFDTPVGEASFSVGKSFLFRKGLTEDSLIFGPYDFYFSIGYDI
ncbi:MAG: patatin-like phospholipase family protein [bacterium]|nr:patatin-like phospholipase family protein [bacterium]